MSWLTSFYGKSILNYRYWLYLIHFIPTSTFYSTLARTWSRMWSFLQNLGWIVLLVTDCSFGNTTTLQDWPISKPQLYIDINSIAIMWFQNLFIWMDAFRKGSKVFKVRATNFYLCEFSKHGIWRPSLSLLLSQQLFL